MNSIQYSTEQNFISRNNILILEYIVRFEAVMAVTVKRPCPLGFLWLVTNLLEEHTLKIEAFVASYHLVGRTYPEN